jgi:hypothetical protein
MRHGLAIALAVAGVLLGVGTGKAQQPPPNPMDVIPDKMPFNVPYGSPITLKRAQAALQAALDEATKRGWEMNVTVVGPTGDLVAFARMDNAQLASVQISQQQGPGRGAVPSSHPPSGGCNPKVGCQVPGHP